MAVQEKKFYPVKTCGTEWGSTMTQQITCDVYVV